MLNTISSVYEETFVFFIVLVVTGLQCEGTILRSFENIMHLHCRQNYDPNNMYTVSFSTTSGQMLMPRSSVQMNKGTTPSMFITASFLFPIAVFCWIYRAPFELVVRSLRRLGPVVACIQ